MDAALDEWKATAGKERSKDRSKNTAVRKTEDKNNCPKTEVKKTKRIKRME